MMAGFAVSIPFWLQSTPEEQQQMVQMTMTKEVLEQDVQTLDIQPEEQAELRQMLKQPDKEQTSPNFEQVVWEKDISHTIQRWVPDSKEAESIARWVYFYSVRFDLSPELILGMIAVESRFDHFAISSVGARGLMQVMPFWKETLGSKSDNLFEIETNIRYGCAIIRHYLDRYKKIDRALAAYNGSLGSRRYPQKVFSQMKRFKSTLQDIQTTKL